jgi:broad specificity phosphatase PhoE
VEIVLVRHGATDWNLQGRCQGSSDRALCEAGERQAREIAASLSSEKLSAIYSSGLMRARHTAQLISQPHGLPVQIENDVRELDHGQLEGLTFEEIKDQYPEFIRRWRTEPAELQIPGGERLIDVQQRAWTGLNRIAGQHSESDVVVVVSHNFPILGIICQITGTPMNSYRTFRLEPCGHSRLHLNERVWRISHINGKTYP